MLLSLVSCISSRSFNFISLSVLTQDDDRRELKMRPDGSRDFESIFKAYEDELENSERKRMEIERENARIRGAFAEQCEESSHRRKARNFPMIETKRAGANVHIVSADIEQLICCVLCRWSVHKKRLKDYNERKKRFSMQSDLWRKASGWLK